MNVIFKTSIVAGLLLLTNVSFGQSPQTLPFAQDWTNIGLITVNDDWSGVPGIIGYRGDDITTATGVDPQTLLGEGTIVVDVNANQTNPNTFATGGVTEFHIPDPVVALTGSGTADAPNIIIAINTLCQSNISVTYNLRDIDGSTDNSIQPVALQYRIGSSGNFTNIPAGFVADASSGPSLATLVTPVSVTLPAACENQANVQLRVIGNNAVGNDEWIGIDDINITATNNSPTAAVISGSGEFCEEGNLSDIPVIVTITGGTSPYTVVYTDGTTQFTLLGYISGTPISAAISTPSTYTLVSVTDANGCAVLPANLTGSAIVTENCGQTCDLSETGLTGVHCEDNNESGTNAEDDFIWFQLNPTGTGLGSGYDVTVSSGTVLLNGSVPAIDVPYGNPNFFRLQQGSAGAGNVTLTVTDNDGGSTCFVVEIINDPGSCSFDEPTYDYFISDPCVCDNNSTAAGNNGTFGEVITVTGPVNGAITGTCTGCTGFTGFMETVPGTYVSNTFHHTDGIGYSMDIYDGNIFIGTVANYCAYPDININPFGPFSNCPGQANIPLTATVTDGGGTGSYSWSGDGVTGINFNPSGLPAGIADINLSYTGAFGGNTSSNPNLPAYPGCIQVDTSDIIINNPVTPNAGTGGFKCPNSPFQLNALNPSGTWSGGLGTYNNPNIPNATYTPAVSESGTTVILTWTANGACPPGTDTIHITVGVFPTASAGMNMSVCFGPVVLMGSTNASGIWTGGLGSFANAQNPMTTYTPAASEQGQSVTLTFTVTNSCGSTNASVVISFSPNQAEFFYNPNLLCTNGPILLPSHNTGINGTYTYTPITGTTLSLVPQSGAVNPALSAPGSYKVTNTVIPNAGSGPSMIITGIVDAPLTGGLPKAIELYVINSIPNLSLYGLENASNGAASAGVPDFVFPNVSVAAGTFIYVATEVPSFLAWFGFSPTFTNNVANNNGDDAILLYANGVAIDAYGVVGVDGTGQPWESLDGWAHRNSGSCPTTLFTNSQWSYSGVDAWDDDLTATNSTSTPPYPVGMFTPGMCAGMVSCPSVFMDTITIRQALLADAGIGSINCGASTVNIQGSPAGGVWSGGSGVIGNVNNAQTTYTPTAAEVGMRVKLFFTYIDQICGSSIDSVYLTFLEPAGDAEFSYQDSVFCPNGPNPVVSHTTGSDGTYSVTQGNPNNVDLNSMTGEIELTNTQSGTYQITNTFNGCGNLMITAVVDGPLTGGQPKAIEFFALNDIPDLSLYGFGIAFNGGNSNGVDWTFPSGSAVKGQYIYVANNLIDFQNYFGFAANYLSNQLLVNGNDVVEVFCNNVPIDVFGELHQDGTGTPWEYMDGWVYRKNNTVLHGSAFVINDWIYSGPNATDNSTTNATSVSPTPVGTYSTSYMGVCPSSVYSVTIRIGDNIPPMVTCPSNITIGLDAGECSAFPQIPVPTATDNCPGNVSIVHISGPNSGDELHKDDSPFVVVYEITDANGNAPVICSFTITVLEYPNPSHTLACNNQVNVSLSPECDAVIGADVILEGGPYGCYEDYIVHISGQSSNIVTHIGTYTVTVTDPETGNSCWGTILVEDKLPPIIECPDAVTILCYEFPYLEAGIVDIEDCSPTTTSVSVSTLLGDECDIRTMVRTFLVTDAGGFSTTCSQLITVLPATIGQIFLPQAVIQLTCGSGTSPAEIATYFDVVTTRDNPLTGYIENNEGYPYAYPYYIINGHPQKIDENVCSIYAVYQDLVIDACGPSCGGNKKIVRTWTILNWCTAEVYSYIQLIKASDHEPPTAIVKDITVSTSPWYCAADFDIPQPWELHDNCDSNPHWTISGPSGVIITGNQITGYRASGAPKGVHLFVYTLTDCCGNFSAYPMYVTVVDKTAPVAVALQDIVVSLTSGGPNGTGNAKIFPYHIDNGSYDQCGDVHLEIRRTDGSPACNNWGLVINPTTGERYNNNVTYDNTKHEHDNDRDTDGGQYVKFCCEDLTEIDPVSGVPFGLVQVWLRVWDDGDMDGLFGTAGDNYNETWAYVRVEDKLAPVLTCPPDVTVYCDMDLNISTTRTTATGIDLSLTGGPAIAYGTCGNVGVDYQDLPQLNSCNVGTITRRYFVAGRNDVFCVQRITVLAQNSFFNVTPPGSSIINTTCNFTEADIKDSEKPVATGGPCDVIGENITIDTFYFEDGACKKWRVRYEYINWCTNELKGPYFRYYKYEDQIKPELTECEDRMFPVDGNCESVLTVTNTATDEGACTGGWLKWQVFVDLWADGTYDWEFSSFVSGGTNPADNNNNGIPDIFVKPTSSGQQLSITVPGVIAGNMSNHKVSWKVTDGCGNVTACDYNVMIVDKKDPTPYCVSLSSAVMANGQVELWARDFDKGSFDNCTPKEDLLFTFNEAHPVLTKLNIVHYFKGLGLNATEAEYNQGNAQKWVPDFKSSSKIFDCDEVPSSEVHMTVWDGKFNSDFCVVILNLVDNQNACDQGSRLMGEIFTTSGESISKVKLTIDANRIDFPRVKEIESTYNELVPQDEKYTISMDKKDDYTNGVSTLDIVMIQRHILNLAKFDDPYKMIAADVTNDGKVNTVDLIEIRKLILGTTNKFNNASSWEFMPVTETMTMTAPYDYSDKAVVDSAKAGQSYINNFYGVKLGDVNGSAHAIFNPYATEKRSDNKLTLTAMDKEVKAGDEVLVEIKSSDFNDVYGYQFTLSAQGAKVIELKSGALNIADSYALIDDKLTMSFASKEALSFKDDEVLFTVILKADKNGNLGEMMALNSEVTQAESYTGSEYNVGSIGLQFRSEDLDQEFMVLYQNEPNPFKSSTVVNFYAPIARQVDFTLTDASGKVICTKTIQSVKGLNKVEFSKKDIPVSGIVYCTLVSGDFTATKTMIAIE